MTSTPPSFGPVRPILRMFDVPATLRFYVDYLGCTLDWRSGEGDLPEFLRAAACVSTAFGMGRSGTGGFEP